MELERHAHDPESCAPLLEIATAADRAAGLTRQLLAFARKQVLRPEVLDLNAVVTGIEKMLRRLLREDVALRLSLAPEPCVLRADQGQLEQVLMNLAVNAQDSMPRGGTLTVETAIAELDRDYVSRHPGASSGTHVMLAVSDTGSGMDPEVQAQIFEPFFTTKELGKGTGLGLSTVYGIVKQSGGSVYVYSEPGEGTTFKIYLPQLVDEARQAHAAEDRPQPIGGTETVFLAKDDAAVRSLLQRILVGGGYTVIEAANGAAALDLAARQPGPIHLLLTDLVMPGMGGMALARELTASRPETRVIYLSGYAPDAAMRQGGLESGAAFLEKPVTPRALLRKLREVLDETVGRGTE